MNIITVTKYTAFNKILTNLRLKLIKLENLNENWITYC